MCQESTTGGNDGPRGTDPGMTSMASTTGPPTPDGEPTLLDRVDERRALDELVAAVASGVGRACVVHGEAGMGKTRLLQYAVGSAADVRSVWVAGVEAERDLGYAGLHRLLRPFLDLRTALPGPQRSALASAFGLHDEGPADRFLVGLACLTLLTEVTVDQGLLCVIDDAQWIDEESLATLAFVGRRLSIDRIGLLFGVRDGERASDALGGLPTIAVEGLPDDAALDLLSTRTDVEVDADLARRVVAATSGCPLALLELASDLTDDQLRGGRAVREPFPIGPRLEEHFLRQVRALDEPAQLFALIAAADTSGDAALVRRVAADLDGVTDVGAAEDAVVAGRLLGMNPNVVFRHPLIRSAIYGGAPTELRRTVHTAIAAHIDPATDPDRRAHHLAAAAREPDESLAAELEQAAARAGKRGGYSAESSFLLLAAQLTPAHQDRAPRMLRAATAAFDVGLPHRAEALLDHARSGFDDDLFQAEATRLDGRLQVPLARPPAAPALLVAAARAFAPHDRTRARNSLAEAIEAGLVAQQFTAGTSLEEVGRLALTVPREGSAPPALHDLLLDGMASLFTGNHAAAMPILREAVTRLARGDVTGADVAAFYNFGVVVTNELWDDEAYGLWSHRAETVAREHGALIALQVMMLALAKHETRAGRFAVADAHYDETIEITRAIGGYVPFYELLRVDLNAWRGLEDDTRRAASELAEGATAIGSGAAVAIAQLALATLELGVSRYADALAALRPLVDAERPGWTGQALPLAIEAAMRTGERTLAERCAHELHRRATAAGTAWGIGLSTRSHALIAPDDEAEAFYRRAISQLERTSVAVDLAHSHLLYGEWLRRQGRRRDARAQLETAHDMFSTMGAAAFARRAHSELTATGARVRRRAVDTQNDLTAQEAQVARLAARGATNPEIAASLFISSNTVDYHLRKVYRKLGITSRRQLAGRELHGRWTRDPSSPAPARSSTDGDDA